MPLLRINNDLYNPDWIVHVQFTPAAIATAGAAAAPAILKVLVANLGHVEAKGVEAETIWAELSPEDNAPLPGENGIDTNPKSATYGKAVAIEVKTKNGHTDLIFSDGLPEKTRAVLEKIGLDLI